MLKKKIFAVLFLLPVKISTSLCVFLFFSACVKTTTSLISLYPVKAENELYGYIDNRGELLIEPLYNSATVFSQGYALVKKEEELFFIDLEGQTFRLADDISMIDLFFEERARAVADSKVGYLQLPDFTWAILPQWSRASRFSEKLATVETSSGTIGYINREGVLNFEINAHAAGDFHEDRAWFVRDGQFGVIDKQGNIVLEAEYSWIGDYHEGLARVRSQQGFYGYVDKKGSWVIKPQFSQASDFSEGLALAFSEEFQNYGYINTQAQWVIGPYFVDGGSFIQGKTWIKRGQAYYYITKDNELLTTTPWLKANNFQQELALVRDESGSHYINSSGEIVW